MSDNYASFIGYSLDIAYFFIVTTTSILTGSSLNNRKKVSQECHLQFNNTPQFITKQCTKRTYMFDGIFSFKLMHKHAIHTKNCSHLSSKRNITKSEFTIMIKSCFMIK